MKITFLGGGNMAAALVGGMLARGFEAAAVQVIEPDADAAARLAASFAVRIASAPDDAALACDALVLAVKPQQMRAALAPLAGRVQHALAISIAAGLRVQVLARWLGAAGRPYARIVRCMPNTPALVGAGVTGLYAAPAVDAAGRALAERILGAVGMTIWTDDEARLDAVTAISGSGPAYVFHFIEALEAAARAQGFDAADARRLALGTVAGATRLAEGSADSAAELRRKVTSRGGTTEAALASLAAAGWHDALVAAVAAAAARSRALGDELGKE